MAVVNLLSKALRIVVKSAAIAGLGVITLSGAAIAQQYGTQQYGSVQGVATAIQGAATGNTRTILGERYIPNIWVDPDGCEHWVMDDGVEGYMTPHTTRQGIPVCRRGNVCGVMNSDQFFATNSHHISASGRQQLANFFQSASASAYIIAGHTDSRASDDYNMRLSYNRAATVAAVAQSTGARVADVRGYGERMPRASNGTRNGMAQNRRVEIICIR
ncbi:OmpA family protein [Planktotalea arctica]|uniref:OmpA family protein n=1 Tax=Planktotalea arctica TaxID=1481893 RepID=UPI000A172264|nr:OmpA family protein [Planktotalea arctica]